VVRQSGRRTNSQAKVETLLLLLLNPVDREARQKVLFQVRKLRSQPIPPKKQKDLTVAEAIEKVLSESQKPMQRVEIKAAVEKLLGRNVAVSSLRNNLRRLNANTNSNIQWVGRGLYKVHNS
jgi:ribosomal protein L18